MHAHKYAYSCLVNIQVALVTELEERLPSVRLCFFNKFHMLTKRYGMVSHLMFFQSSKFDDKVKAVKDSNENSSCVIEKYQV